MYYVGVIGAENCTRELKEEAKEVGKLLAGYNMVVLCGGHGGIMKGVAKGAHENGGTVIGILPGVNRDEANPYLSYTIPTGLGEARNAVIARSSDVVIAISGGTGTLSEIGLSLKMGKKVIGLQTWDIISPESSESSIIKSYSPAEAVQLAVSFLNDKF